jgi:hypothetical protein
MPPIATVGFGLGIGNWTIALGALLLFATNLIAIALAAAGMAALYGFRPHFARRGWIGQGAVILIVVALCIPLTLSLNTIALESRATVGARAQIKRIFGAEARLTSLKVRSMDGVLEVDGLVATPKFIALAPAEIERRLRAKIGAPAHVNLDQVVIGDPARFATEHAETSASPPDPTITVVRSLRAAVPFPARAVAYDAKMRRGVVALAPGSGLDLAAMMALEQGLRGREGLDGTIVIPPVQPLPPIVVILSRTASPAFGPMLASDTWALQRWDTQSASAILCGLAGRRRERDSVAKGLAAALAPITVTTTAGSWRDCRSVGATEPVVLLAAP